LQAPRRIRAKKAKKAKKRATLLYAGVYRGNARFQARSFNLYNGNIDKHLGTFDTQEQAAQAIAAHVGYAAGGGLRLRVQPVEESGFRGVTMPASELFNRQQAIDNRAAEQGTTTRTAAATPPAARSLAF
jgi:hypothetical protein